MSSKDIVWTNEVINIQEDELIKDYFQTKSIRKWTKIANALHEILGTEKRSGKQCRERWHNHLDPNINKEEWTDEEKTKIFELQKKLGNKWSKIALSFNGRTDNSIKNCFYSVVRKNLRRYNKKKSECEKIKGSIKSLLRDPKTKPILMGENTEVKKCACKKNYEKKIEIVQPMVSRPSYLSDAAVNASPSVFHEISPHFVFPSSFNENMLIEKYSEMLSYQYFQNSFQDYSNLMNNFSFIP